MRISRFPGFKLQAQSSLVHNSQKYCLFNNSRCDSVQHTDLAGFLLLEGWRASARHSELCRENCAV